MKFYLSIVISALIIVSCASNNPMIIVDPASVTDEKKVIVDREECYQMALSIDLDDEVVAKSIGGAALGSAGVAGIAALAYGAVFAPAIPFIIAGGAAGGGLWGKSASDKEKRFRNNVMRKCMVDRGYKVYTGDPY
tara:strand:+ start:41 stop:448 length:408 start_codon:yes stop_codon:yes gene_type:complete